MAYNAELRKISAPPVPCECEFSYTQNVWTMQITSVCKKHWPRMTLGQKLNILKNEGAIWIQD